MNKDFVKVIGIKDKSRLDAYISYVNQVEGLKDIFNRNFNEWSNFDGWGSIAFQQWIFSRALQIYRGKKIDIKCDCCEYIDFLPSDFENIMEEKCYGKKSVYMIKKVVEEISSAKKRRKTYGVYFT